jgi:CheY-like chemotaxis protein
MVQAEHYSPDVVLLDIGIPGMSGYEVCRRLRQQPWGRATMIATMTDWGQKEDRRRAEAAGFDQHLLKPVDHAALTQVLVSAPSTLETPAASNTVRPQC